MGIYGGLSIAPPGCDACYSMRAATFIDRRCLVIQAQTLDDKAVNHSPLVCIPVALLECVSLVGRNAMT